ncbi:MULTISPECIES: HU family DNA-binding protein [Dermacoccus]|jgi:DNA-binding protein HU-beta|uniref:HU family DNA-binding protein n=1 Tax=Dermacoccus TaxID=57495 RepID=UPI000641D194|nr:MULTISPECIES: HU family DNA-binding protein [Dermacoccus]KLO62639.1 DNA-binding protein [Dermacoccus sp. PE3]MBZ4498158.1 HU family DNA-binding protein [Dermacoccus sp. Tok2021]MCT1985481.1 HU family DNA-binding protein [Dermacoccus abyssi]QNK51706.1 HU family DNA-binding protein [Dermacoccus sp. PAMC28757]RYI22614.1 HU family DNA-binding protein [Dermacoccus sp. 147Ba]
MNKADLVDRLEERLGSKRAALEAVEAVVDVIIREVAAGNKVGITGFGTFERVDRAARTGRNPRTGEAVHIDATAVPKFTPGTNFKVVTADPDKLPRTGNAGGRASASR